MKGNLSCEGIVKRLQEIDRNLTFELRGIVSIESLHFLIRELSQALRQEGFFGVSDLIDGLKQSHESLKAEIVGLEKDIDERDSDIIDLQEDINEREKEIAGLEKDVLDKKQEIARLVKQIEGIKEHRTKLLEEIEE